MFKKNVFIFLILLSSFFLSFFLYAEAPVLKTLSARVVKVEENAKKLHVDFRHPVTEEVQRLIFEVDQNTGFSGIKGLEELKLDDAVNIDYVENNQKRLFIRRIARIRLSGPPPGLEDFRGF